MQHLDLDAALGVLAELEVLRIAVFDMTRQATYAIPLAFAVQGRTLLIVLERAGRMAHVLPTLERIGIEADDVRPDLRFRSVAGTARPEALADSTAALAALAARYGAQWGLWRPVQPQAFALHIITLEGRSTLDPSMK